MLTTKKQFHEANMKVCNDTLLADLKALAKTKAKPGTRVHPHGRACHDTASESDVPRNSTALHLE